MSRKSSRSKVEVFRKSFISLARDCGGSYATTADRMRIARYFLNYLQVNGIKLRQTGSIKTRHISGYLLSRKEQGSLTAQFRMNGQLCAQFWRKMVALK